MLENIQEASHQLIRLAQLVLIPLFAFLFGIGWILYLTSGKNPIRKRRGMLLIIFSAFTTFSIAYIPAIVYTYAGEAPSETGTEATVEEWVDRTVPVAGILFNALKYIAIPVTGTMLYVGLLIRLLAGKNPSRKRLGIGMALLSPLTMAVVLLIPLLLPKL
jgi:hypothetical protein